MSRFAWVRGYAAVALALLVVACSPRRPEPPAPAKAAPAPAMPAPPPPLDRAALLRAVEAAGSAYAAAGPYPAAAAAVAGRRFRLRLPFGCGGPAAEAAASGYAPTPGSDGLRIFYRPESWTDAAWARALVGGEPEAIEGFWLRRPWLFDESCPRPAPDPAIPILPSSETVALVQAFAPGGSRFLRRQGKAYAATLKPGEAGVAPGGFRLALSGRIADPPDHRPVRCVSDSPDRRPLCVVLVEFDHIAFEDAAGKSLAEWGP